MELSLIELESLQEAIALLNLSRSEVAAGSLTVWRILKHATEHLDRHLAAALTEVADG
jgi:hypothetical protein